MDSGWLGCAPLLVVAAAGLGVALVEGRMRDWWGALTRREPLPDVPPLTAAERQEIALRAIAEARLRGYARVQGVTVLHVGVAEGFRVGQIPCSTDDQALRVLLRVME